MSCGRTLVLSLFLFTMAALAGEDSPKVPQEISFFEIPKYSATTGEAVDTVAYFRDATPKRHHEITGVQFSTLNPDLLELKLGESWRIQKLSLSAWRGSLLKQALLGRAQIELLTRNGGDYLSASEVWVRRKGSQKILTLDEFLDELTAQNKSDREDESRMQEIKTGKYGRHLYRHYSDWAQSAGYYDKGNALAASKPSACRGGIKIGVDLQPIQYDRETGKVKKPTFPSPAAKSIYRVRYSEKDNRVLQIRTSWGDVSDLNPPYHLKCPSYEVAQKMKEILEKATGYELSLKYEASQNDLFSSQVVLRRCDEQTFTAFSEQTLDDMAHEVKKKDLHVHATGEVLDSADLPHPFRDY